MAEGKSAVIITAAGSSRRMQGNKKKEYCFIGGRTVLEAALLPFFESGLFEYFVLVIPRGDESLVRGILKSFIYLEKLIFIEGGATRQESVFKGLCVLKEFLPELVLIHDGARPYVSRELVELVFLKTREKGACIPVVPALNAMKRIDRSGVLTHHYERIETVAAQTPQGFCYRDILKAHEAARKNNTVYIDDSEIYSHCKGSVYSVSGDVKNSKITYKHDLEQRK